jgi:hypothetical protein
MIPYAVWLWAHAIIQKPTKESFPASFHVRDQVGQRAINIPENDCDNPLIGVGWLLVTGV